MERQFMRNATLILIASLAILFSQETQAATWNVDMAHSTITFSVKHMMLATVHGTFNKFSGVASFDASNPKDLSLEGTIDAASVDTRNEMRDNHLRSGDFFDVTNHPQITFKSTKVVASAPGKFAVSGDLTMRGVTKEITLELQGLDATMTDPQGSTRTAASATGTINRMDFGLNWNKALEAGGVLVGNEVQISLDVELVKAK
jgi:polyisoprenoid-binding protein YceI